MSQNTAGLHRRAQVCRGHADPHIAVSSQHDSPLRELMCHMGSHGSPGRGDIPALTPAEAGMGIEIPSPLQPW